MDRDIQEGKVEGIFVLFQSHGLLNKDLKTKGKVIISVGNTALAVPCLKPVALDVARKLAGTIRDIKEVISDHDPISKMRGTTLLFKAISDYCEADSRENQHNIHREANRLRKLIKSRAFENIPLLTIYKKLDISTNYAETLFVKAFGITAVAYRIQLRLTKAREILTSSKFNVTQTAYFVGFTDPLYFSRIFRKTFGITPSSLIIDFKNTRK